MLSRRSLFLRYARGSRGSAAIEFSILAPIFFGTILSAFEIGLVFLKISMVEMAADDVAREIYTGQAADEAMTREDMIDAFCDRISATITCDGNVTLLVEGLNDFSAASTEELRCVNTGEVPDPDDLPSYQQTGSGQIVYLRFCVTTPLVIPGLKNLTFQGANIALQLPETANGRYAIIASTVFRNEPFTVTQQGSGS